METELRLRRDLTGSLLGLAVFLGGIALLLFTFKTAYALFTEPPARVLGLEKGQPVDLGSAGSNLVASVFRVVLLVVMAIVGSIIANRGIQLYTSSRAHHDGGPDVADVSDEIARFTSEGGKEAV